MARRFEKDPVKKVKAENVTLKLRREPNDYESNRKQRRLKIEMARCQVLALKRGDVFRAVVGKER